MIYILISSMSNEEFFEKVFNNEKDAIAEYKKNKSLTFEETPYYRSVQLFELNSDPQEKGKYPIYKPTKKYVNEKWVKTKFYKKFMLDFWR